MHSQELGESNRMEGNMISNKIDLIEIGVNRRVVKDICIKF